MKRTIRAGITAALLVGGVAGLATVSSVSPAAGDVVNPPSTTGGFATYTGQRDAGKVVLATDPDGKMSIAYFAGGGSTPVEKITYDLRRNDKCLVDTARTLPAVTQGQPGKKLLDITLNSYADIVQLDGAGVDTATGTLGARSDQRVGLVDNGLGTYDQNNCNQSNGRVEAGSAITLALGDYFPGDIYVDWAEFDIEGKFGTRVEMKTDSSGTSDWFPAIKNGSDNNADSGATDNDRVSIGVQGSLDDDFRKVSIAPVSSDGRGQLALEGGGDYDVSVRSTQRTVLYLAEQIGYEYVLVCDSNSGDPYQPNTASDSGTTNDPTDDVIAGTVKGIAETPAFDDWTLSADPDGTFEYPKSATVFRYRGTVDGTVKPCDPVGANLSADDGGVLLQPSDETAFLRVELIWVIPASAVDLADGDPFARTVDLDGDGPLDPQPARFCDAFDGSDPFDPAAAGQVTHPTDAPWCVITDERNLTTVDPDGDGPLDPVDVVIQRMVWDGLGDPRFY